MKVRERHAASSHTFIPIKKKKESHNFKTKNAIKNSPECTETLTQLSPLLENVSTPHSATAPPSRRHCREKEQNLQLGHDQSFNNQRGA